MNLALVLRQGKNMRMMFYLIVLLAGATCLAGDEVLVIADEFPAMEVLASRLRTTEGITTTIAKQEQLPQALGKYRAVIVYVHGKLSRAVEHACVNYAREGGRLVVLHHSISSGKRTNEVWFGFLGVRLPNGDVEEGGYKWIEPATYQIVALERHFVTTNKVVWPERVAYVREKKTGGHELLPGFTLHDSEVYLNHYLEGTKTVLLGFKYKSEQGKVWMQDRAGWYRSTGKGTVFYFQPGHSRTDFENEVCSRLVINAVIWKP
ncbi:MAG: ThuA domain-containing protein [Verrucomicrobiae bacterium]|nr:ThuA domain-containing protein [Verrucomicrobiae bacterium]